MRIGSSLQCITDISELENREKNTARIENGNTARVMAAREVANAYKKMQRKGNDFNVGNLYAAVEESLYNTFMSARNVEELNYLRNSLGAQNMYVAAAYANSYEAVTGEVYTRAMEARYGGYAEMPVDAADSDSSTISSSPSFNQGGMNTVLQSNAAENKTVESVNNGYAYNAITAEGNTVKVYGFTDNGQFKTTDGVKNVGEVRFEDNGAAQLFNNASEYDGKVADVYISAYKPGTDVKGYDLAFMGLFGEGQTFNTGKDFEGAYETYGKIGNIDYKTAKLIYDMGGDYARAKKAEANKKAVTPKGITGEVTESTTGSLTDRERAIYNTIATEFKVNIDVVGMTGDGSLGYANTVTRRIVSSLASGKRISTLLHESGHIMKAWALDTYNEIQDAVVSWYEKHTDKALDKLIEARQRSYAKKGEIISPEEALDEVTNNALEAIQRAKEFDKTFVKSMAEDGYTKTEAYSILAKLKAFFEKLKNLFRKVNDGTKTKNADTNEMITAEGKSIADIANDIEMMDKLLDLFTKGMNEVRDNYDSYVRGEREGVSDSVKAQRLGSAEEEKRFSEYNKPITISDIKILRSINRKFVNSFTEDDIYKAQKWAYNYYKDIGIKSPFFRSWFGDWRAFDKSPVTIAKIPEYIATNEARKNNRGVIINRDTSLNDEKDSGWEIRISREGETNTISHSGEERLSEYGLAGIRELIENAVLLDSEVHEHHSNNAKDDRIAFDHKFYALGRTTDGTIGLYKITVEESFQDPKHPQNKRFHNLRYIEKVAESIGSLTDENEARRAESTSDATTTKYSVADLFDFVKTYDPEFKPRPVHESMIENGQPKVFYHGSPAQFTAFDKKKARSMGHYGRGFYFSDSKSHAGTYGNTYSVYLNIANPLKEGESKVTRDQVKDYLERVAENEDYSIENYGTYDIDTILDRIFEGTNEKDAFAVIQDINATAIGDMVEAAKLFNEVNGTSFDGIIVPTETVAFEPEQIKSATWSEDLSGELDNIGTFSKYEADIQFQKKKTKTVYATEIEEGVFRYNGVIYDTNKIRADLLDNYTEKDYNRYAWAVVNGIVKEEEIVEFRKRLAEIWQGSHDKKINVVRVPGTLATFYFRGGFTSPIIEAAYNGVDGYEDYMKPEDYTEIERIVNKYGRKRDYTSAVQSCTHLFGKRLVFGHGKTDCPSYGQLKEFRENGGRAYFGSLFDNDGRGSTGSDQDSEVNTGLQFQQKLPSDRAILADALESVSATNEKDADIIRRYKAQINTITDAEKRLGEVNEKIKSLAFAKGKRDTNRLRVLYDEKAELVKKIDRFDKSLLRLESTSVLKNLLTREKAKVRAATNAKAKEKLNAYKERAAEREANIRAEAKEKLSETKQKERDRAFAREEAIINKFREANERGRENRSKSELRGKIKKFKAKLEGTMLNPTDRTYVPAGLFSAMIEVCDLIDTDTSLYKADGSVNKAQARRNLTHERLLALEDEYKKLKPASDKDIGLGEEYEEAIAKYLSSIRTEFSGKTLAEMTLGELDAFYNTLVSIQEVIADSRKLIGMADAADIYEAADSIADEQQEIKDSRKNGKRNKAQKASDWVINKSLAPMRAVERMSGYNRDSYLVKLFKNIEQGVRDKQFFMMTAYKSFEDITTGDNAKAYENALYEEFGESLTDKNGHSFRITKMQAMQALMSYEREQANKKTIHVENGGFSFADRKKLNDGKIGESISDEHKHIIDPDFTVDMIKRFKEILADDKLSTAATHSPRCIVPRTRSARSPPGTRRSQKQTLFS